MARTLAAIPDWTVLATARSRARVEELRALLGDPANFRYVVCDQADLASVREATANIKNLIAAQEIPSLPVRSAAQLTAVATAKDSLPRADLRGGYVESDRPVPSSPESHDPGRERDLFEFLDTATGLDSRQVAPWWSKGAESTA